MVNIEVLEKSTDKFAVDSDKKIYKLKLLISGETPIFLNVLKRTIEEEMKTLAIEDVYVIENNSAMWDEFIAHRLGLIPLNTPENLPENAQVKLYLEKEGKGYVYSSDIKSENPNVYPVYSDIPIAYLEEGHKIKMEMVAIFGNGKIHSKWIPAYVYYYRTADIVINEKLDDEEIKKIESLGVKVKKDKIEIPKDKRYDRTFLDAIESVNENKIKVVPKDEFVFYIESFGNYSAERIIPLALNEMKQKVRQLINFFME